MNIKPSNTAKANKPRERKEKRPPKKITDTYLHNAGLYYLQRFAASSYQFREVMIRKARKSCMHHKEQDLELCIEMIDQLVEKFKDVGLLDDNGYTKGVVSSMRRQGKSQRAIIAKLKSKGINTELALEKLSEHQSEYEDTDAELRAAFIFARKKRFGPFNSDTDKNQEKALGSMARAGFKYDTCRRVLNCEKDEAENFINL